MQNKSDFPECQVDQYINCLNDERINYKCEENCPEACSSYSFTLSSVWDYDNARINTTRFEIGIDTFDYAMFNETYKWTMESFLGEFGGALGVWLGIDLIKVLRFVTTIFLFTTKMPEIFEEYKIERKKFLMKNNTKTREG